MMKKVYDLEAFKAWLSMKSPEERYEYGDPYDCVFAQWLKHCGLRDYAVTGHSFGPRSIMVSEMAPLPNWFSDPAASVVVILSGNFGKVQEYFLKQE